MAMTPSPEQNEWVKRTFGVDVERAVPTLNLGWHLTRLARHVPNTEADPTRSASLRDMEKQGRDAIQAGDLRLAGAQLTALRQALQEPGAGTRTGASAATSNADAIMSGMDGTRASSTSPHAPGNVQLAQAVLPGPIPLPLPLPPGGVPSPTVPPSWERAVDEALRRAGRRMAYTAQQARDGNIGDALRHAFVPGTTFPPEVDDPDATGADQANPSLQMSRPTDDLGRPLARGHTQSTPMQPPGDCDPEQHAQLQADVDAMCKSGPISCKGNMTVPQLQAQLGKAMQCVAARDRINSMCFAGGDLLHRRASDEMWKAVQHCTYLLRPRSS